MHNQPSDQKQSRLACGLDLVTLLISGSGSGSVSVLTDSELLQAALKLRFLLQDPQKVRGLHALQLHLPVDVDFVIEAHVNQTGAVLPLLTRILTYNHP